MKNKNQLLFFILCVIVAAVLFLFLYQHRTREHAYTAQLQKEAASEEDSAASVSESTGTAVPAASVAPQNMISDSTASSDASESAASVTDTAAPQIRLKTDAVTIPLNSKFSYMDYIASMTDDKDDQHTLTREVELDGSVDTSKAGDYTLTYTVRDSSGKMSNKATLKVTVR